MERIILWLKSCKTGKEFPITQDQGDTDMGWDGYIPLQNENGTEIMMSKVLPSEISDFELTEKRTKEELKRSDLRVIHLLRSDTCKPKAGESFKEYLKRSKSYKEKFYYTDIFDPKGEAISFRKESMSDFLSAGGIINYHPKKLN